MGIREERYLWTARIVPSGSGSGSEDVVVLQHFPASHLPPESIVNVVRAGDALAVSVLASLVQDPRGFEDPGSLREVVGGVQAAQRWKATSRFLLLFLSSAGATFLVGFNIRRGSCPRFVWVIWGGAVVLLFFPQNTTSLLDRPSPPPQPQLVRMTSCIVRLWSNNRLGVLHHRLSTSLRVIFGGVLLHPTPSEVHLTRASLLEGSRPTLATVSEGTRDLGHAAASWERDPIFRS